MKAISLLQPWATLCAMGIKHLETRSRNTKYRGDLLIHASLGTKGIRMLEKIAADPLNKILSDNKIDLRMLPLGKIVGMVWLEETYRTEVFEAWFYENHTAHRVDDYDRDFKTEQACGDFSPKRFFYEFLEPVFFSNNYEVNGSIILPWEMKERICLKCGCTESDCKACIEKTGHPCYWINEHLCSACKEDNSEMFHPNYYKSALQSGEIEPSLPLKVKIPTEFIKREFPID